MAFEWPQCALPDLVDFQEGPGILAKDFHATGIPLIRLKGVDGTTVTLDGCNFLDPEKVATKWKHFQLEIGDLIISTSASLGRVSEVGRAARGAIAYTGLIRFRPKSLRIDRSFLRCLLGAKEFLDQAEASASGSVIRHFGPSHLRRMILTVPPLAVQRQIGTLSDALNARIDHNRALAANLEAIARRLFKSWFVDFDPVRAKAAGEKPSGLADDIAILFPDRFVESELGEIPEGWRVETVGDLSDVVGGTTPRTKEPTYWNGGIHAWATPKDLSALLAPILLDTERQITDAGLSQISSGLLPKGTVLLSSRAPIGYLAIAEVPVSINQGFIAMKPKTGISNIFLLLWASVAREEIVSRANGSTFLEISKANFRPIPLIKPTAEVMQEFDQLARPLYEKVANCVRESRTLSQVRDLLLPRLISGKIRVSDAQAQI